MTYALRPRLLAVAVAALLITGANAQDAVWLPGQLTQALDEEYSMVNSQLGANEAIVKTPSRRYERRVYRADTLSVLSSITYRSRWSTLRDGPARVFNRDGSAWIEGQYAAGKKTGRWRQGNESGFYKDDLREGMWLTVDNAGDTLRREPYRRGRLHGARISRTTLASKPDTALFEDGRLLASSALVPARVCGASFPGSDHLPCGPARDSASLRAFQDYVYEHYPFHAVQRSKKTGSVTVSFTVSDAGEILSTHVAERLSPKHDRLLVATLRTMPDWLPSTINGVPVASEQSIEVRFD